jgi:transglutaminase-like putative cysteine protease
MSGRIRWSAVLLVLMLALVLPHRPALAAEPAAPARVVSVQVSVAVKNPSSDPVTDFHVVVPPAVMSRVGTQRVLDVTFETKPQETRVTSAGTEAVYVLPVVKPGESMALKQTYLVELFGAGEVMLEQAAPGQEYLAAAAGAEADDPGIRAKAAELTRGLTTADAKAEAIMKFVTRFIAYDYNSPSRNKGALAGFTTKSGVCSEYAGLFVAMARATGVPARLVYGWANSESLNGTLNGGNRHVWAEYYSAEKGWVQVDPTFATVLPLDQVMRFDGLNHVAQDRVSTALSSSYLGNGYLRVSMSMLMANTTVAAGTSAATARP